MKSGKSKKTTTKPKAKEENDEFFTEEEVKRLDKFHDETEHLFDDTEVYDLMQKYGYDDEAILNELKEQAKERKRGDSYEWKDVGKRNYIFYFIIFN